MISDDILRRDSESVRLPRTYSENSNGATLRGNLSNSWVLLVVVVAGSDAARCPSL